MWLFNNSSFLLDGTHCVTKKWNRGYYDCQNWTTDVLEEAVKQNLLDSRVVVRVLIAAREIQPL